MARLRPVEASLGVSIQYPGRLGFLHDPPHPSGRLQELTVGIYDTGLRRSMGQRLDETVDADDFTIIWNVSVQSDTLIVI